MSEQCKFSMVGGQPRVNIETAADVKRLPELDPKLWTVLSCPVSGLELEEQSLALLDSNGDGSIHINEINDTVRYLDRVLTDISILLSEGDQLPLALLNREDAEGEKIAMLLENREMESIDLAGVDALVAELDDEIKAKIERAMEATEENLPFGDKTESVSHIVAAVEEKVNDYFARCSVARYADNAVETLDVKVSDVEAMSAGVLSEECNAMERMPLARVNLEGVLCFAKINPAWKNRMETLRREVLLPLFGETTEMKEEQWREVKAKVTIYRTWAAGREKAGEALVAADAELAERRRLLRELRKLVMLRRDFYRLLCNYVTFSDFYGEERKAIFQAGELFIDERCCELCMKVESLDISIEQARHSGMFLIYCFCESKSLNRKMHIVAALTAGNVRNIRVGTHALFVDRAGNDYDATVVHIIDNPISIGQAFYMPYKKFVDFIENQVAKLASDKEQKVLDDASAKIGSSTENISKAGEVIDKQKGEEKSARKQAFDIAKFCGIFAAIGMAIGYIGGFLASAYHGFIELPWWKMPLAIIGVMLIISGPSMIIAWLKLRKRDLSPLLNANGWAMNTALIISILFGNTLTTSANISAVQIPDIKINGVIGGKGQKKDKPLKWLVRGIVIAVLVGGAFFWFYFGKHFLGML